MDLSKKNQDNNENNFANFPPIGGLLVSKMVVDENIKPRFMYREKRTVPGDSGWRIFTGTETDAYANNPANLAFYHPTTILEIDPSLKDILLKGIGSVFEKMEDNSKWYQVFDFELDDDYMTTHQFAEKWTIDINNLFERTVEKDGDLLFTTGDKSVRLIVWNEANKNRDEIYAEHKEIIENRDQSLAKTLQQFDFSDNSMARPGYLIKEKDGLKTYHVIHALSIVDNQILQAAFYFDDDENLNWAIETWKNIKFEGS